MNIRSPKLYIPLSALGFILVWVLFSNPSVDSLEPINSELTVQAETETSLPSENAHRKQVMSQEVLGYASSLGALPDSLDGTYIGNLLAVDESGHLRISSDIQRVFDFFLSTINEESLDTVLARIDEYLTHYLQEPALSEARDVLSQYLAMKEAMLEYQQDNTEGIRSMIENGQPLSGDQTLSLLEKQLNDRNAIRAEHLRLDVREAFYGEEEVYDQYTLSRLKINADSNLSAAEKENSLAALDQTLPPQVLESRQRTQATDILQEKTQALLASGGTQEDVRALRTEMFGAEAADRFEALDQERALWDKRLESYLSDRQEIIDNQGLTDEDRAVQIDSLRATSFDSREQIRVRYLETLPNG